MFSKSCITYFYTTNLSCFIRFKDIIIRCCPPVAYCKTASIFNNIYNNFVMFGCCFCFFMICIFLNLQHKQFTPSLFKLNPPFLLFSSSLALIYFT